MRHIIYTAVDGSIDQQNIAMGVLAQKVIWAGGEPGIPKRDGQKLDMHVQAPGAYRLLFQTQLDLERDTGVRIITSRPSPYPA